ncbi:TPR repeat-containing protein [Fasciolopsis buskii]|uniref:TPR repeat-containing protein n=1 Tax=Fasciolopsis buskii TaxID=27845 RepID=A0A8E0VGK6_9TREM|nr:TPR repeat-containing protein [Fasciolopsis buski]
MPSNKNTSLVVIGAGLARTGTSSLKDALELLYQEPCYHMSELLDKHPNHGKLWSQLFDVLGEDRNAQLPEDVIREIFEGYVATTDYPACAIYEQLMNLYPEAKVILTVRAPNQWIQSIRETVNPKQSLVSKYVFEPLFKLFLFLRGLPNFHAKMSKYTIGSNVDKNNDDQMIEGFIRWNDKVKKTVPADKLLVFEVKEGWKPLCQFLNKPIPNVPFPHVNDRASMKLKMKDFRKRKMRKIIPSLLVVVAAVIIGVGLLKMTSN